MDATAVAAAAAGVTPADVCAVVRGWGAYFDALEEERGSYDYVWALLVREAPRRRAFVLRIKHWIEQQYAPELHNPLCGEWAELHHSFFARALADNDENAHALQCMLLLHTLLYEAPVLAFFAPPQVNTETTATAQQQRHDDAACVDRAALRAWLGKFVKPVFDDLHDGERYTMEGASSRCAALYDAMLPGDPVLRPGHAPLLLPLKAYRGRE